MGSTRKDQSGITSSERGSTFNLNRNKAHASAGSDQGKSAGFPDFPKPGTDAETGSSGFNAGPSNVKPGVEYADDKPGDSTISNEKPSDSSFFDATKSSENENSDYDSLKPDSQDKSSFDSDSFFDETESSDTDRSSFEMTKPDSKDRKSFDSEKSTEFNGAGFESVKPIDKPGSSRFEIGKVDVVNQKREFSSRPGIKQPFLGAHKSPSSTDKQFLAGTPKIKFVMGRQASGGLTDSLAIRYPKRTFHSTLRDRIFYLSEGGEGPAYDYSSVYGPSASLLYDGGDAAFFLDGAEPEEEVFAFKKK
ncbi:uncharacterized protein LOC129957029 [Argiope bruennichi]|uniref:uncharacterized protein LOC129957029 n=1 Tax=Argiope bruennichi TaxID=94029 RepID=UPI0024948DB6|nr:uncharacterized protein LOC129957029 [Argiope bruennichi]